MDIVWSLLLQVVLIGLNAVFACAEIAVLNVSEPKLEKLAEEGNKKAIRLARLKNQPARFLATIQVAITLSGFIGSAFAAENFADVLVDWVLSLGLSAPREALNAAAVVLITLILSYFTLVLGELVPKRVAMRHAEKAALGMSGLITFISHLFAPIVWLLTKSTNGILRLLGIDPNEVVEEVSEDDIRLMVDAGNKTGTIDNDEMEFIENVFEFDDLTAGEIATHRTEVALLWLEEDMAEWERIIYDNRHTMYPVCHETPDNVVGVLNAKDFFRLPSRDRDTVMREAVKPAYLVPEGVKADVLFRNMKTTKNRFAIVLDEYGGMAGIVTVNDLVECLVGDLVTVDETEPEAEAEIERLPDGSWKVLGIAPLSDVEKELGVTLPTEDHDTFGGYVFAALGAIPEDGSTPELETEELLSVKITEVQEHQLVTAIVTVLTPAEEEDAEPVEVEA